MLMMFMSKAQNSRFKPLFLLACAIIPLLFFGCSCGKTVENNTTYHDRTATRKDSTGILSSKHSNAWKHDSIFVHDSVAVLVRGDSTITDRWHTKTIYKLIYLNTTDTLVKERYYADTLRITDTQYLYKTVEKPTSVLTKIRCFFGDLFFIYTALNVIILVFRRYR